MSVDWVKIGPHRLACGDCLEILPTLAAGSIDAVVTDPPYGTGAWLRDGPGKGRDSSAEKYKPNWDVWDTSWLADISAKTIGFFCPQTQFAGFRRLFLWLKPDPRPRFLKEPAWGFEPFVLWRGKARAIGGTDYLIASSPRLNRGHPNQKPLTIMRWLVRLCSDAGDVVLDPFMGSGTTGVAADELGRVFIGIERERPYFDVACKQLRAEVAQQKFAFKG